ncbi:WhiB family transcriptional regulator [Tessaracoccus sp. Z1128]
MKYPTIFLHPLLEDGASAGSGGERREQSMLESQADAMCASCPLQARCLTDAVTRFDVSGFVAGTTRRQRQEIRLRLGVEVPPDNLDALAGAPSGRQFDRHEIHRLRTAHPTQPLSVLASKIGCSVSTIKRHLRKIEEEGLAVRPSDRPRPTPREVMAVASEVRRGSRRAAAA